MTEINHFKFLRYIVVMCGDDWAAEVDSSYIKRIRWGWFVYIVIEDGTKITKSTKNSYVLFPGANERFHVLAVYTVLINGEKWSAVALEAWKEDGWQWT
jgi:hypothetical protein